MELTRALCTQHGFDVEAVFRVLDSILPSGLQTSLRRTQDLTPEEKQPIYEDATRVLFLDAPTAVNPWSREPGVPRHSESHQRPATKVNPNCQKELTITNVR